MGISSFSSAYEALDSGLSESDFKLLFKKMIGTIGHVAPMTLRAYYHLDPTKQAMADWAASYIFADIHPKAPVVLLLDSIDTPFSIEIFKKFPNDLKQKIIKKFSNKTIYYRKDSCTRSEAKNYCSELEKLLKTKVDLIDSEVKTLHKLEPGLYGIGGAISSFIKGISLAVKVVSVNKTSRLEKR